MKTALRFPASRRLSRAGMLGAAALSLSGLTMAMARGADDASEAEAASADAPRPAFNEAAYDRLGELVLMHEGRPKPFDTVARQEVKAITERQSFTPVDPDHPDDEDAPEWSPVAALFSWMHNPRYWDDQRFILADYIPFREIVLAQPIQADLRRILADVERPEEVRTRIEELVEAETVSANDLKGLARDDRLADDHRERLLAWSHRIDGHEKYLSPYELEIAEVTVDGSTMSFRQWVAAVGMRLRQAQTGGGGKIAPLDKKVEEVYGRLLRYQAIRGDHEARHRIDVAVDRMIPRPANEAYLSFVAEARRKYDAIVEEQASGPRPVALPRLDRVSRDPRNPKVIYLHTESDNQVSLEQFKDIILERFEFTPLEQDALLTLAEHYAELQQKDRKIPGADAEFDQGFLVWLEEDADWAPLEILREAEYAELIAAGYPSEELNAFRQAIETAVVAEQEQPGALSVAQTDAVVTTARQLAEAVNLYPTQAEVDREVHYNRFAPFYKAPTYYGLGFVLLSLCLMMGGSSIGRSGPIRKTLYGLGLAGLLGGIGIEVYGFYLRVLISGWAPVTNLYETVIWVALVTAVIGAVLEAIYRRVYAAAAASGVAMLCTIIAANATSVLNPNIEALQPVLRSNYWLTIHVITIVSSYAAFALAMGLGLMGTLLYLTAVQKRDVSFDRIFQPLLAAPVLGALGAGAIYISYLDNMPSSNIPLLWGMAVTLDQAVFALGWTLAAGAIGLTVAVVSAGLGEAAARWTLHSQEKRLAAGGSEFAEASKPETESAFSAIDKIRSGGASNTGASKDPRALAMSARVEQLKPLSSFVYRALQVGVLLVAAGTILGGVWADYSWGRFWGWDPKEVSALITLLIYLIPLHGRFAGWIKPFGLVAASVLCFNSVLMAWYGVNFLLGVGLHSYGFAEGGNQGAVLLTALIVSSITFGAILRRSLARRLDAGASEAAAPAASA